MPNNIYSSYFSKIFFSFIDEKIKLDIIKYNKAIQASLNISLINYKVLSGKYIIKQSKKYNFFIFIKNQLYFYKYIMNLAQNSADFFLCSIIKSIDHLKISSSRLYARMM